MHVLAGSRPGFKGLLYPSAKFNDVVRNARPRRDVVTVVIAGSNDVDMGRNSKEIVDGMHLEELKAQANRRGGFIVWVELFPRYDKGQAFNN